MRVRIVISRRAAAKPPGHSRFGPSSLVAAGILGSRITGLVRERVVAHFFGASMIADVFRQSIRIPNLLGNLFGEGVLSASFVTVYSKLRASGQEEEAEHVAEAVFGILALLCAILVFAGVVFTPALILLVAPGFRAEERALTIHVVRILFPGTGFLVMSAWCLGVLNSHRHFLLSYMAPVVQNATMIIALFAFGSSTLDRLILYLAWASVLGSALTFLVQLPRVLQLLPAFRPTLDATSQHVRSVIGNFGPIFLSRGVVQISAYVDSIIASLLPTGAVAILGYGQIIAVLPVSLFSMSISAAELPALSSAVGNEQEVAQYLATRLTRGLRRIAFLVVPSAMAFLALGDVLAAALYQSGRFSHTDAVYVWGVLAGSAVGLLATCLGRLYSSAFYSLLDTRAPLRFAIIRVALTTALGFLFALSLPRWFGVDLRWGVAGLSASAGIAGWVEFSLLRRALTARIGSTSLPREFLAKLWAAALMAAALAWPCRKLISPAHPISLALLVIPIYGAAYFAATALLKVEESTATLVSIRSRVL